MGGFGALIVALGFFFFEWRHAPPHASKTYRILALIGALTLFTDWIIRTYYSDSQALADVMSIISAVGLGMMVIFGALYVRSRQRSVS